MSSDGLCPTCGCVLDKYGRCRHCIIESQIKAEKAHWDKVWTRDDEGWVAINNAISFFKQKGIKLTKEQIKTSNVRKITLKNAYGKNFFAYSIADLENLANQIFHP